MEMTVTLTEHKVEKLKSVCSEFLNSRNKTIRDLSVLIGNLVASFPAFPYGQLFYRQLEIEKIIGLGCVIGVELVEKYRIKWNFFDIVILENGYAARTSVRSENTDFKKFFD